MVPESRQSLAPPDSGDALSYDSLLPLGWTPLAALPESSELDRFNDDNLRVLTAVALICEQRGGTLAVDEGSPLECEVARLHQKMNLLIDLLSFVIGQQSPTPQAVPVRLSWHGVGWRGSAAGLGIVRLHLHRSVPQAFQWPARVASLVAGELYARFEPLSEPCQAALERHVFLHHRRAIAGTRRPSPSP